MSWFFENIAHYVYVVKKINEIVWLYDIFKGLEINVESGTLNVIDCYAYVLDSMTTGMSIPFYSSNAVWIPIQMKKKKIYHN